MKYDELMDKIEVTDAMRARILRNVSAAAPKKTPVRRYALLAACLAVVLLGAVCVPKLMDPAPQGEQVAIANGMIEVADAAALADAVGFPAAEAASKEEFAERIAAYGNHFWLLFKNGKLVSFMDGMVTDTPDLADEMYENAALHDENGAWQMIFGVNTIPECRKKGYAGQLIRCAIEQAKKEGRKGLVLTCKDKLLHYYENFGFVNEGVSKSVHGNVVWYQMRLTL